MGDTDNDVAPTCLWITIFIALLLLSSGIITYLVGCAQPERAGPGASFYYQPYDPAPRFFHEMYQAATDESQRSRPPRAKRALETTSNQPVITADGRFRLRGATASDVVQVVNVPL